ncbi:MAG: acyltransferase [Ginsengibacter sp.]
MFKKILKKIPLLGPLMVSIKRRITTPSPLMRGKNNSIVNQGMFHKVIIDVDGNNNKIIIGRNSTVKNALIYIRGNNHKLIIGENCFFGGGELWIEDHDCSLIIYSQTTIEHAHLAVTEPGSVIEIHKDCMLAKYVEIRTGDSHSIIDLYTGKRINPAGNVILEEHVWVGAHAKILKGVTVGHHSVIGSGSMVTNDVPSNSIAAGVPAKIIRNNIDWKRERLYEN